MELVEVGQQNPRDGPLHLRDLGAEAVVLDVAEHLLAVFLEQAGFRAVVHALGFDEQERIFGLEQVVHRVAEDFELAHAAGFGGEPQRAEERFQQQLLGGFLRFLLVKTGDAQTPRLGNQRFQFDQEMVFHPGFDWHEVRVWAGRPAASIPSPHLGALALCRRVQKPNSATRRKDAGAPQSHAP